ncbi:MAG: hypothetical protein ABIK28_19595 [Planctomycetota bacterium]
MTANRKRSDPIMTQPARIPFCAALAFFLTGAACLLLEVVWARSLTLVFGGTVASVSTVIAAFMAGLGAGSALFGKLSDRLRRPDRLFILLALGTGMAAPLIHWALPGARLLYGMVLAGDPSAGFLAGLIRFVVSFALFSSLPRSWGGHCPRSRARWSRARIWETAWWGGCTRSTRWAVHSDAWLPAWC